MPQARAVTVTLIKTFKYYSDQQDWFKDLNATPIKGLGSAQKELDIAIAMFHKK